MMNADNYYDTLMERQTDAEMESRPTCPECGCELRLDSDVQDWDFGKEEYFWVCDGCGNDCVDVPLPTRYL
jgi:uncharacterized protein with PIN domain